MSELLPYLKDKSLLFRISTLIFIVALSLVISMVAGILLAIPFFGVSVLTDFYSLSDLRNPGNVAFMKYFQVINQIGVFILPAIVYAYLENRKISSFLNIKRKPQFSLLLIAVILIIVFIPAVNTLVQLNEQMKLPDFMKGIEKWMRESEDKTVLLTEAFLKVNTTGGLLVNLFIIGLMAAVGEELLFRGVILRLLMDGFKNPHFAVLISSIMFSALHLQFYGFLPRTALGIVFGYVFIWSGSLWIPVILHFIFNGISVVAAFLFYKGIIITDFESFGSTDNVYIIAASFILSFALLILIYRKRQIPLFTTGENLQ